MNTLLILFETPNSTALQNIVGYIQQSGSYARLNNTAWLVKTPQSATDYRNNIMLQAVGARIVVFNVTGDGWGTTFSDEVTNWMKENIKS